jgi:hypothetical protein
MPTEPKKPLIVISYAHADEPEKPAEGEIKWLSFVTGYLRPAIKKGAVDLWLDRLMLGVADWEREFEQKLRACDIFIPLVSRHSLSSDYVLDKEIAMIRERQGKGEAVYFYPLVLTPTPTIALDLVRDKNLRPRDGKPFSDFSLNERYRHMADAADEIAEIARQIVGRKSRPPVPPSWSDSPEEGHRETVSDIRDRKSLEAWLKAQSREVAVAIAARAALRYRPSRFTRSKSAQASAEGFRAHASGRASGGAIRSRRALRVRLDRIAARRRNRRGAEPALLLPFFQRRGSSARAGGSPRRRRAVAEGFARPALQRAAGIRRGARILSRRPAEDRGRRQHSSRQRSGPHTPRHVSPTRLCCRKASPAGSKA